MIDSDTESIIDGSFSENSEREKQHEKINTLIDETNKNVPKDGEELTFAQLLSEMSGELATLAEKMNGKDVNSIKRDLLEYYLNVKKWSDEFGTWEKEKILSWCKKKKIKNRKTKLMPLSTKQALIAIIAHANKLASGQFIIIFKNRTCILHMSDSK